MRVGVGERGLPDWSKETCRVGEGGKFAVMALMVRVFIRVVSSLTSAPVQVFNSRAISFNCPYTLL